MDCATATRSPERFTEGTTLNPVPQHVPPVAKHLPGSKASTANTVSAIATRRSAAADWSAPRMADFSLARQGNDGRGHAGRGSDPASAPSPARNQPRRSDGVNVRHRCTGTVVTSPRIAAAEAVGEAAELPFPERIAQSIGNKLHYGVIVGVLVAVANNAQDPDVEQRQVRLPVGGSGSTLFVGLLRHDG